MKKYQRKILAALGAIVAFAIWIIILIGSLQSKNPGDVHAGASLFAMTGCLLVVVIVITARRMIPNVLTRIKARFAA